MKWLERFWFSCGHCHDQDSCPMLEDGVDMAGTHSPWRHGGMLVGACAAVFLVPLVTGVIGAWAAARIEGSGEGDNWPLIGMVLGAAVGIAVARGIIYLMSLRCRPNRGENA